MSTVQPHHLAVRVYWEDTDAGGIVYHASHIRFLERGRTEYLRALGLDQSALMAADNGKALLFVVRRMELDYLRPARLDDMLTVTTRLADLGAAKLVLEQALLRGDETILTGVVTVAAVGGDGRAMRIPPLVRARFSPR